MTSDREQLRAQLVARFESHPPSTWSAQLLEVVVNAIDLQFGANEDRPATAAALRALPSEVARDLPNSVARQSGNNTNPADVWLTADEFAARIQIPKTTVKDWRVDGRGPQFAKVGRHVRYRLSDVQKWEGEQFR
ncbi:hypothetical protein BH09ACT8_BH09ACT8_59030 [soil metagenome]